MGSARHDIVWRFWLQSENLDLTSANPTDGLEAFALRASNLFIQIYCSRRLSNRYLLVANEFHSPNMPLLFQLLLTVKSRAEWRNCIFSRFLDTSSEEISRGLVCPDTILSREHTLAREPSFVITFLFPHISFRRKENLENRVQTFNPFAIFIIS